MRIVHLSDLHLGFRAFPRSERGGNLRERDLGAAFRWALQEVVRIRPDLVLITGDLFDRPDPPATAQLTLHRGLGTLRRSLAQTPVLVVAGGHDTPVQPDDPGPVAVLEGISGVEAAAGAPRAVRLRALQVHALLVPHRAVQTPPLPLLEPDPQARWNLLLLRGTPAAGVPRIVLQPEEWSYIALGGSHRPVEWARNTWSSGSLERPCVDPWAEGTEERGFLSVDLASGQCEFHAVPGRPVVDLAPVRVSRHDPEVGARRLRELLEGIPAGIDGKLVRVRLKGDVLTPEEGVAAGLLTAVRSRAAHAEFQLLEPGADRAGAHGRGGWYPESLQIESGTAGGTGSLPLGPGVHLLTAHGERDRLDLARELERAAHSAGEGDATESWGVRLVAAAPADGCVREFWCGTVSPEAMLRREVARNAQGAEQLAEAGTTSFNHAPARTEDEELGSTGVARREDALRDLRADAFEAAGDLEALTMDWARQRQDADSKLAAYRDSARELRERLRTLEAEGAEARCPTCGRRLGTGHADLMRHLREEWEALVQDGRWWKRRRGQLEDKPDELRRLEEEVLRLHAALENSAEALERLRGDVRRGAIGEGGVKDPEGSATPDPDQPLTPRHLSDGPYSDRPLDDSIPTLRTYLRAAANLLASVTGGRVSGVVVRSGVLQLAAPGGAEWTPQGEDRLALSLAIRLTLLLRGGSGARTMLVGESALSGSEGVLVPFLDLARTVLPRDVQVVIVAPPSVLERIPEGISRAFAFERTVRGGWVARPLPTAESCIGIEISA